jgi:hypothetical protein
VVERCREVIHICFEKLCNLKYVEMHSFLLHIDLDGCNPIPTPHHLQRFHGPRFLRVPEWIGELHSISELELDVQRVLEDGVGLLAQLPSLINLHLQIRRLRAPKDKILIRGGSGSFPVLKYFCVICCRIWYLSFEAGAMPMLERLELGFNAPGWDRCGAPPAGIEHLSGLKEVFVNIGGYRAKESNRSAAESALRNAVDMHPGRPVANIKINDGCYMFDDELWDADEGGSSSSST